MQISKRAQYGLRAMTYIAKKTQGVPQRENIVSLKETSKAEAIPFSFLEKIIGQLEKAKLVVSKKGVQGGYSLAKKANKITVAEIVSVLEKTTTPVDCRLCGRAKKCLSKNVWAKVNIALQETLKSIKLSDLIK